MIYYIYEHIRPDTNMVFYVGKGKDSRAYSKHQRNKHWHKIVNKVKQFNVNIIAKNLDEELAFLCEVERIDQLKRLGVKLCNVSFGGDGPSGYTHTNESKRKIGENSKISLTGRKQSDSHRLNISLATKGLKKPIESVEKSRQSRIGVKRTEEQKLRIRLGKLKAKMEKS